MQFRGFDERGACEFTIPDYILCQLAELRGGIEDYIDTSGVITLTLQRHCILLSHLVPCEVLTANRRMVEASEGRRPRRRPIQVRAHTIEPDSFVVCDGNSTFCNLAWSGFDLIPVEVIL